MNKRRKVNTNLIPHDMMIKYTYQKCVLPALIIVIISLMYLGAASFGSEWLSNKLLNKAVELKVNSVYGENLILEKEITELQTKVNEKEKMIESLKRQNESSAYPIYEDRYKIESLISYINDIKPKNVTIILIEDSNTSHMDNRDENEYPLKYRTDIGNSIIQIRGFSTNKESLASFLQSLGAYEEMANYKVNAIETVKVLDDDLDVFDIVIMPR